jgi:hypothetical protein
LVRRLLLPSPFAFDSSNVKTPSSTVQPLLVFDSFWKICHPSKLSFFDNVSHSLRVIDLASSATFFGHFLATKKD